MMGESILRFFQSFFFILTFVLSFNATANESTYESVEEPFDGQVTLSLGRNLDKTAPATSFTFEPIFNYHLTSTKRLTLYSAIDRPTNPQLEFTVPKTILTYQSRFPWAPGLEGSYRVFVNAVEMDRWSTDGYMVRMGGALDLSKELFPNFSATFRMGPFAQASQYRQRTNGADIPRFGLNERIGFVYDDGLFSAEALLVVDQVNNGRWNNDFGTSEQVGLTMHQNLRIGLSHELLSSVVDDSTGFYRPVRLFDGRDSRISAFADIIF